MTALRLAKKEDAVAILDIYAPYIKNTSITFETEVPSVASFAERIENYLKNYPWLVCEINGKIAGYAYGSKYRERTAYQWSIECSVYVDEKYWKHGVAKALYTALFEILKQQGFMNVYAVINLPNEKSVAFHERLGFIHFADFENVGYKLGKWKTVGWWQRQLNEFIEEPPAPIKFSDLHKTFIIDLLNTSSALIK